MSGIKVTAASETVGHKAHSPITICERAQVMFFKRAACRNQCSSQCRKNMRPQQSWNKSIYHHPPPPIGFVEQLKIWHGLVCALKKRSRGNMQNLPILRDYQVLKLRDCYVVPPRQIKELNKIMCRAKHTFSVLMLMALVASVLCTNFHRTRRRGKSHVLTIGYDTPSHQNTI